jgi:hypothetical protein
MPEIMISFAITPAVASILAPRMVMPPASSSTTRATRSPPGWSFAWRDLSACGLMMT